MAIDWDFARKAALWTLEEACSYVCPRDAAARARLDALARRAGVAKELPLHLVRRPGLFLTGTPDSQKYIIYVTRAEFLAFAQKNGYTLPPDLADTVSPASGAPLHGSERDSLLRMVLGMAMSTYDYTPGAKNRATGENQGSISADLQQRGLTLDPDTVRKFLREAETRFEHLLRNPRNPRKT